MNTWTDYLLVYGGLIPTADARGAGAFLIIKLDQSKGPNKTNG